MKLIPISVDAPESSGSDLVSIHLDNGPDPDDLQASVAIRSILEKHNANFIVVGATQGHNWPTPLSGSEEHTRSLFPGQYIDAKSGGTNFTSSAINAVADHWQTTLNAGNKVYVAEGGPSDFTADVLRELKSRSVSNLKRIHVIQHAEGFNNGETKSSNLAYVQDTATFQMIDNGNKDNNTPDYQVESSNAFKQSALSSAYADQWRFAFNQHKKGWVDFSDAVEVMHILGIPKSDAPDVTGFAARYL